MSNKGMRVLIVDDDKLIREAVAEMLRQTGCVIVGEAQDGFEAIEKNELVQPDIIIMDIDMPNMDGLEASRRIQETLPTPIVALTAHESIDFVLRASEAGIGAYLVKPPRRAELLRALVIAKARFDDWLNLQRKVVELQENEQRQRNAVEQIRQRLSKELEQVEALLHQESPSTFTASIAQPSPNVLLKGKLKIDLDTFSASVDGIEITDLSHTEFTILVHLLVQSPRIITPEELYVRIQPETPEVVWDAGEIIRYHIYRLRKKIKASGIKKDIIRNVRGVGYALEA